ncbi:MAG: DUF2141 domain-containing protein [Pseudoxanthomonas sp.]
MNRISASCSASLFLVAGLLAAFATTPVFAAELTVHLHGIRAQSGLVKVAVVDSQEAWDGKAAPVQSDGAPPHGEDASFTFKGLKPGNYAVLITHDENGNGKLDTNVMGMPLEGYGFSNNPQVMRKPTWDEARFEIGKDDVAIDVALH